MAMAARCSALAFHACIAHVQSRGRFEVVYRIASALELAEVMN
jgi:hypothetical protein